MIAVVKDLPPAIRVMRQSDVAAVAAIECATYQYPWSIGIFRDCLLAGYTNVVLDRGGEIIGYAVMSVAAGEAHLLNICLMQDFQRQGIGRRLLEHLMARARAFRADRIFLEVRPSNSGALNLYHAMGFEVLGVRRDYYKAEDGKEDAVVLVCHFPETD
jgi:ribosomal-protein-alanine N-acetyltransferase